MSIDYFLLKRKLKKEHSYLSIQQELSCYRKAGIEEYTFLSNGCDVCNSLNGKSFPLKEGRNKSTSDASWLQMHNRCKK